MRPGGPVVQSRKVVVAVHAEAQADQEQRANIAFMKGTLDKILAELKRKPEEKVIKAEE